MGTSSLEKSAGLSEKTKNIPTQALCRLVSPQTGHHSFFATTGNKLYHFPQKMEAKKIGELHVNRKNYRNFEKNESNFIKELFAKLWMKSLVRHLKKAGQVRCTE